MMLIRWRWIPISWNLWWWETPWPISIGSKKISTFTAWQGWTGSDQKLQSWSMVSFWGRNFVLFMAEDKNFPMAISHLAKSHWQWTSGFFGNWSVAWLKIIQFFGVKNFWAIWAIFLEFLAFKHKWAPSHEVSILPTVAPEYEEGVARRWRAKARQPLQIGPGRSPLTFQFNRTLVVIDSHTKSLANNSVLPSKAFTIQIQAKVHWIEINEP